jgi:hypothetical protein
MLTFSLLPGFISAWLFQLASLYITQGDVRRLLAEGDISTGRIDAAGNSLDVLTLLRWSFDRLPSDNHRCGACASAPTFALN